MPKVIFFNGPPFSGKDTCVAALAPEITRLSFADPLKDMFERAFGYQTRPQGLHKEYPMPTPFAKVSYRQGLIAFSEAYMKPLFGKDVFGKIALKTILLQPEVKVWGISDSGFVEEVQVLTKALGKKNCCIVQVLRDGKDFQEDSRSYISHEEVGADFTLHFSNNESKESVRPRLLSVLGMWIQSPAYLRNEP